MHLGKIGIALFLPVLCVASEVSDQITALRNEVEQIKQSQQEIEKSLQAIKDVLTGKRPAVDAVPIHIAGSPIMGSESAKLTIVEFSDFQCPYCGAYARDTFGQIVEKYVRTGRVRYVSRNFPVEQTHPLAQKAAEAALCANEQGKYWETHALFFNNQKTLETTVQLRDASATGIDLPALEQCTLNHKYAETIKRDISDAISLGVRATPTFFLGYPDPKDSSQILAVKYLVGSLPVQQFEAAIEDVLNQSK